MKCKYQIPFFNGRMQRYADDWHGDVTWRDNYVFRARLQLTDYGRGRSAAFWEVDNLDNGEKYSIFMTDFNEVLLAKTLEKGLFEGYFTFIKRGQNYGLRLATDKEVANG